MVFFGASLDWDAGAGLGGGLTVASAVCGARASGGLGLGLGDVAAESEVCTMGAPEDLAEPSASELASFGVRWARHTIVNNKSPIAADAPAPTIAHRRGLRGVRARVIASDESVMVAGWRLEVGGGGAVSAADGAGS